jgi:phage tail-like protein
MHAGMPDTQESTFLLLDGRTGWRTGAGQGSQEGIATSQTGLQLAASLTGPLSFAWPDGSLGGLVLPRGMALDDQGRLYLLQERAPWRILRFDAESEAFLPLAGVGGPGHDPRFFHWPRNLAIAGNQLYVADSGNRRVQVFDLHTLVLRHVWEKPFRGYQPRPVDIAAHGKYVYILVGNRVFHHTVGSDRLIKLIHVKRRRWRWQRVVTDREGNLYLLRRRRTGPEKRSCQTDLAKPVYKTWLDIYSAEGSYVRTVSDAGEVRDGFEPPALRLFFNRDHRPNTMVSRRGFFCLPESLARLCDRQVPDKPPAAEALLELCLIPQKDGLFFDRNGQALLPDPAELVDTPVYRQAGSWISEPLDSQIYQCQWHRVELDMAQLPPGCRIRLSTYTSGSDFSRPSPESALWQVGYDVAGAMQPSADDPGLQTGRYPSGQELPNDFLVQSRQGQYLWIKVDLFSDGFATPRLGKLKIHFPRHSYLEYLPAVYASDDESRWFLERFLSVFQTPLEDMERQLNDLALYFDIEAVPAGPFLDSLASWFGLPMEDTWSYEQRRNLLRAVRAFYPRRGTLQGLRAFLQVYLQNMTSLSPDRQRDLPLIVESFRERRWIMLDGSQDLKRGSRRLWSPSFKARIQVGGEMPIGEARVNSGPEPAIDLFQEYGHRFQIYVPASWVGSAEEERMLRRAVEAEKPAHTTYDLCLVEARFRVGVQSTIGLDSILGCYPVTRLACQQSADQTAPSRIPNNRLGRDTILGGSSGARGLPMQTETIVA